METSIEIVTATEITFDMVQQGLTAMKAQIATMQQQLRALEKAAKVVKKEEVKKGTSSTATASASSIASASSTTIASAIVSAVADKKQKKISGFCVQEPLSAELCEFMKLPPNSKSSRTTVSTAILNYIRTNKLQDATVRKIIKADASLKTLFKLRDDEELTYFNIQKYINQLFV
jgi:chromatin remodeling complex protein RSC6